MLDKPEFRPQQVHESAYIAPTAIVAGDVSLAAESSVWFGAVVRGDCEAIRVGPRTNIQDNAVLHADYGFPCTLGAGVTVGHGAIVHGATVGDNVVIGMKAVVQNGAKIGENSLIAVGAVIPEGAEIPPGSLVMGLPGKIKRPLEPHEIDRNKLGADHYVENSRRFAATTGQTLRGTGK